MRSSFALSIHHVGGRGGSRRFPTLTSFERDLVNVLYEADDSAINEMKQEVLPLASRQIIIEACVGAAREQVKFYQLWNSAASSYLPISESFKKNYPYMTEDVLDYDDKAWSVTQVTELHTASLDQLILQEGRAPAPDFLSLNTQGSELDIIKGAEQTLERHVIVVQTELSFPEIYEGQAGFDDIARALKESGFRISTLLLHGVRGHGFRLGDDFTRTPIGLRGGGAVVQADALFFKDPQKILDNHADPGRDLAKALFLGFIFKYFDFCYACASALKRLAAGVDWPAMGEFRYARFVADYLKAIESYPLIFPPLWTNVFASGSGKRLEATAVRNGYFSSADKEQFKQAANLLINPDHFGLEKVALDYGLTDQAEALRFNRLASIWNNMRYLGLVDEDALGRIELRLDRIK